MGALARVDEGGDQPQVLDIDATIKPLYGRQEGAELGYNAENYSLHIALIGGCLDAALDLLRDNSVQKEASGAGR